MTGRGLRQWRAALSALFLAITLILPLSLPAQGPEGGSVVAANELPAYGADGRQGAETEDLLDIYRLAERADPQLRGQHLEREALLEEQRAALGALLPSATISGEIRYTDREEERAGAVAGETERTFTQQQYMANISQPLFNLPAWHEWQASQHSSRVGEAELEMRRQELVHQVAEVYLGVLSAQSNLALQERELEAVSASLRQAQALHEEREIAPSEYEQARARHDNVKAEVIRAEGELEIALEELSELTDSEHRYLAELRSEAELPRLDPLELDEWLEHAYAGNPELLAARAELDAQGRQVQAAAGQRYPSVDLVAGYTRFDDADDVDMDDPDYDAGEQTARTLDDYYIGVQMQMPLYQGGSVGAQRRSAEHRRDRQRTEVERVRRAVRAQARSAYQGIISGSSEIEAYRVAVRSGERTVDAMAAEVELGTRDVTDLLEAQRELFESQRNLSQARYEYLLNTLELRRAAGHLSAQDIVALNELFE
ncbi:type I secretion outer membrane protein [Halorhodospira halochloris]|uniref:Type I secretion outer membrane protein n=1 Tax=Halorhodospira halochloris TaxID=1052 RepID=A0A0X8X9G5_HALHR|nr:TolC family outer membrane protein [Halorhodospira halochloris]BAU57944.1 type I secretion outer membrane protein [Halorhodospira halochloris]